MSVRSAAQEVPKASPAEPELLTKPAGAPLDGAPAARRPRGRPYTFRRALGHSLLAHGLPFLSLFLTGAGPQVAEGRPAGPARIVFTTPVTMARSAEDWSPPDPEPERALNVTEPPEPELRPVEPELPPLLPAPAAPELTEPVDPLAALRTLPLERLATLSPPAEPTPPTPAPAELAQAEPSAPPGAPVASAANYRPPSVMASNGPTYPHASYRMGHQGSVLLRIHVAADGRVLDVELVQTSGHERLDQAALTAARTWRFLPATREGVPAAGSLLHRVTFRIEDA